MKLALQRAVQQASISREQGRIGWHDLHHTYGSHLSMRGIPLKVIQELMGHAPSVRTMRYAHLAPEVGERAAQQFDWPMP
jgi:integrase